MRAALQSQESAATAERDALAAHVRDVEDRAHAEVDRAREEAKGLRARMAQTEREHRTKERAAAAQLETAIAQVRTAERDAAIQTACAQSLEREAARIDGLPAALLAAQLALQAGYDREAALQVELLKLREIGSARPTLVAKRSLPSKTVPVKSHAKKRLGPQ